MIQGEACSAGQWKAPGWCNLALWLRKYLEEHVLLILPTGPCGWSQFWLLPFVPAVTISYLSANWPITSVLFLMDLDGNIPRLLRSTLSSSLTDALCLPSLITFPLWWQLPPIWLVPLLTWGRSIKQHRPAQVGCMFKSKVSLCPCVWPIIGNFRSSSW